VRLCVCVNSITCVCVRVCVRDTTGGVHLCVRKQYYMRVCVRDTTGGVHMCVRKQYYMRVCACVCARHDRRRAYVCA
jgi:hypothetical protein